MKSEKLCFPCHEESSLNVSVCYRCNILPRTNLVMSRISSIIAECPLFPLFLKSDHSVQFPNSVRRVLSQFCTNIKRKQPVGLLDTFSVKTKTTHPFDGDPIHEGVGLIHRNYILVGRRFSDRVQISFNIQRVIFMNATMLLHNPYIHTSTILSILTTAAQSCIYMCQSVLEGP